MRNGFQSGFSAFREFLEKLEFQSEAFGWEVLLTNRNGCETWNDNLYES